MRGEDKGPIGPFFEELFVGAALEAWSPAAMTSSIT
jgi:hypothetical protein